MATLVLTTVGGAIGGPIGAAIGATLGQSLDRALLFPTPRRTGPRLTELAVQTSSYGTPIPRLFGTMRVAGSVIWATDLIETRNDTRGGKGRPATTSYSYAASFAVALSTRPIRTVRRIWAEGKLLRGAAGDWKSQTGFRLHLGGEDQAPDPLIASLAADAPAHRGMAYAVFEDLQLADFGNRIPSLTFEVVADEAPVTVGAIARAIGGGAIVGAGPSDAVTGFAASGDSVAGTIGALADLSQGWCVPEGSAVRLDNRLGAPRDVDPDAATRLAREPIETVPVALSVSYYDPARDYQLGTQRARRGGAGWREEAVALPAVMSADHARGAAEATLAVRERARVRRRVTLDISALDRAPGDAVRMPGEDTPWRVTRAEVEGMAVVLDLAPANEAIVARPADAGSVAAAADLNVGATVIAAFELPPLDDIAAQVPQLAIAAAGTAPGWRSAALATSRDGISWEPAGATAGPAVMGALATPLGEAPGTLVDTRHVADVLLGHDGMTLSSADRQALDRGANLALIGDELVQFAEAIPLAAGMWRLAGLRRGRRGTAAVSHPAGARFVLIERGALLVLPLTDARPGDRVHVAATGVGDGGGGPQATAVLSGVSIAPPSPVALGTTDAANADALVRWTRRSRLGWNWEDGRDAPLVEEGERYRVVWDHGGVVEEAILTAPSVLVPASHRSAGPVVLTVRQLGTVADSAPASIIIS
jgi:hypothetical protein